MSDILRVGVQLRAPAAEPLWRCVRAVLYQGGAARPASIPQGTIDYRPRLTHVWLTLTRVESVPGLLTVLSPYASTRFID